MSEVLASRKGCYNKKEKSKSMKKVDRQCAREHLKDEYYRLEEQNKIKEVEISSGKMQVLQMLVDLITYKVSCICNLNRINKIKL